MHMSNFFSTLKTPLIVAMVSAVFLTACGQAEQKTDKPQAQQTVIDKPSEPLNNTAAQSSDPNHVPEIANALQENFNKSNVNIHVLSVVPTQMPKMYWATLEGASSVFVDETGKYIFQGDIIELGQNTPIDISSAMRAVSTQQALQAVDLQEMIIFKPKTETKAVVYVFSDPSCHYCQKLHGEIDEINNNGIEVRYLAWPRGESLVALSESVWCSPDRHDAITRAKRGQKVTSDACASPVQKHMRLGYSLGVSGTPAIFAENGTQLGGYLPADELAKAAIANKIAQ